MTPQPGVPNKIEITRILKIPSLDPQRIGQEDVLVEYSIGARNFLTVRVPKANATEGEIEAAVRADAQRFARLLGKSFTI